MEPTLNCPQCGWPIDDPLEIASRHRTANGETVYTRCMCGLLRVWLRTGVQPPRLIAHGARLPASGPRP